jgi:hypothetical protein
LSAALLHGSLISRLICITTASVLRRTTMSRLHWAAIPDRFVRRDASDLVDQLIDIVLSNQFAPGGRAFTGIHKSGTDRPP